MPRVGPPRRVSQVNVVADEFTQAQAPSLLMGLGGVVLSYLFNPPPHSPHRWITKAKVNRWWVTEHGLDVMGLGGLAWQQPWTLSQVLDRLPSAGWFYHVALNVTGWVS